MPVVSRGRRGREREIEESMLLRIAAALCAILLAASPAAWSDGIEPGLWKIISRTESGGVVGPPNETARCLTVEQSGDVATTFSPVARTMNSACEPLVREFTGEKLTWKLICKGQLDMEVTGEFRFDGRRHYTATTTTKAAMRGMVMIDSRDTLDANWVSACP
jgi:hypothetical protein